MSGVNADLWQYRAWNTDAGRAVYWLRRALQPSASYTAKQAAKCFYILACDALGETTIRREIEQIAGLTFPEWLAGVYAEYQRIRDMQAPVKRRALRTAA